MSFRITVLPVAGMGTRFLPATKVLAKELIPVVDRPLIQYAVQEAVAAGSRHMVLVTSPTKGPIEEHFAPDDELARHLEHHGKGDLAARVREAGQLAVVESVMQDEPRGVGHAILQARPIVGDEAFAVMFPDDLILAEVPVMEQLRRVHEARGGVVLAVERVPRDQLGRYGVVGGEQVEPGVVAVSEMVEKPTPDEAPSDLGIIGRYVLPGSIFDCIDRTTPGAGGEIQITDAIRIAMSDGVPCHAVVIEGFDCGSRLGYLKATVALGLRDPELGDAFAEWLARYEPS